MYMTDRHGDYQVLERWVRGWGGADGGFSTAELRRYSDGTLRHSEGANTYLSDNPEKKLAHSVFMKAANMAAYRTVSRLRDGTKLTHNVANVTGYEHARRAVVANVANVRCVLVLVAEIASPGTVPEAAA